MDPVVEGCTETHFRELDNQFGGADGIECQAVVYKQHPDDVILLSKCCSGESVRMHPPLTCCGGS